MCSAVSESRHDSPPAAPTSGVGAAADAAAAAAAAAASAGAGVADGDWRDVVLAPVGTPSMMRAHLSPKTTPT